MSYSTTTPYKFGDSTAAAERLRILAGVFEPSSRQLLESLTGHTLRKIADLGCGPGYTTRLLAQVFPNAHVCGIDNSEAFVSLARQLPTPRVEYAVGDVTQPLTGGPFDLVYCRYLVTHLANARSVIEQWASQLNARGLIVIEENEWIRTTQRAFARYLEIVEAMLASSSQRLHVGAELAADDSWNSLAVVTTEVVPIEAREGDTARMFVLNIGTWKTQPYIIQHYTSGEIDELAAELARLAEQDSDSRSITFGRRRLVLRNKK
jgi:protein-L-isoaspartate O-methyltransferase